MYDKIGTNGVENGEEARRQYIEGLILSELSLTSNNPLSDLTSALNLWLETNKGANGNGTKRFFEQVRKLVEEDSPIEAAALFFEQKKSVPLTGSITRSLRNARKMLAISFQEEEKILLKSEPSPTFSLGRAAHILIEKLATADGDLENVRDKRVEPVYNQDKRVSGISMPRSEVFVDELGKKRIITKEDADQISFLEVRDEPKPLSVQFSDPLPPNETGQTTAEWIKAIFRTSFERIVQVAGRYPDKPSDIESILETEASRVALMQTIEAGHILFGLDHDLSTAAWTDNKNGKITPANVDVFAALDWLALARKTLELETPGENTAFFTEMHEGPLRFMGQKRDEDIDVSLQTKRIDTLKLTMEGNSRLDSASTWGLKTVGEYLAGRFGGQYLKHRRYVMEGGTRKLKETRLRRNVRSLLLQLYEHFGERVFTDLKMDIYDYKFLGGDGNWSEQYDPKALPISKDQFQVSGYMFKVLAQFLWLRKTVDIRKARLETNQDAEKLIPFQEIDDVTINIEEVIEFALQTDLINRVRGYLLYELPETESVYRVYPAGSSKEELVAWALSVTKLTNPKIEPRARLRAARAILDILKPTLASIKVERKGGPTIPESITDFCLLYGKNIYLSIEDLAKLIESKYRDIEYANAIEFTEMGVRVLWLRGLVHGEGTLRIAVDRKGKFVISGLKGGKNVTGKLLKATEFKLVDQAAKGLLEAFDQKIWSVLNIFWGLPKPTEVNNYIVGDEIVTPEGKREKLVPGKPVVCKYDLMTGRWRLDYKLLQYAIDTDAATKDVHGMHELASFLSRGKTKRQVYCPLPTHGNVDTKAAHLYPGFIKCYGAECGETIFVPAEGKIKAEAKPKKNTQTTADFKPVTAERTKTFTAFMGFAEAFAQTSEVVTRYLTNERGISPSDLGPFGYIPERVNALLEDILRTRAWEIAVKRIEHKSDYNIGDIRSIIESSIPDGAENPLENLDELMGIIDSLPDELRDKALEGLKLDALLAMKRRGIFEPGTEERGVPARHHIAERIIFPTYWISERKSGPRLVQSNFEARGIVLDGERRFAHQDHHKAILTGRRGNQTPTGFFFKDPERFMFGVTDTVVVVEGPITAASLFRIMPELADVTLTNVGVGYQELIAFLRWMGVYKDPSKPKDSLNRGIKRVYLASDFDLGGTINYIRNKNERIGPQFPGLEILPIHEVLPKEVRGIVPEFNPELFVKGGRLEGFKFDLNDLLRSHASGWEEKYRISPEMAARVAEIRRKYAFRPS